MIVLDEVETDEAEQEAADDAGDEATDVVDVLMTEDCSQTRNR